MSPEMIETARLLMAHPKCPEGLVMHTVSEGGAAYQCGPCGAVVSEEEAEGENCPHCGAGDFPDDWVPEQSYPDADRIPDLTSAANGGVLLVALEGGWTTNNPATHDDDMWALERWRDCFVVESEHFAHAAALAFLAVHQ